MYFAPQTLKPGYGPDSQAYFYRQYHA